MEIGCDVYGFPCEGVRDGVCMLLDKYLCGLEGVPDATVLLPIAVALANARAGRGVGTGVGTGKVAVTGTGMDTIWVAGAREQVRFELIPGSGETTASRR